MQLKADSDQDQLEWVQKLRAAQERYASPGDGAPAALPAPAATAPTAATTTTTAATATTPAPASAPAPATAKGPAPAAPVAAATEAAEQQAWDERLAAEQAESQFAPISKQG